MTSKQIKMVITDLDGTILNHEHQISDSDFKTLTVLGQSEIFRIIATGRSLYSVNNVLPSDFPIDYLIFSNGAGILNWNSKEILYSRSLDPEAVAIITNFLCNIEVDFMIHKPIPQNHYFVYYQSGNENPDFVRRIKIYEKFAQPMMANPGYTDNACQIIAIVPGEVSIYENIRNMLPMFKVIRTTSPLDGNSIWIEIFPQGVSKGSAAAYLCEMIGLHSDRVLGIGNDYNDLDLLNWTKHSFVVANAPPELRLKFEITDSNLNSGFTKAVRQKFKSLFEH